MSLLAHVDHLRTLAALDPETTVLQMAMVNVLEELAAAVDRLNAEHPHPLTEAGRQDRAERKAARRGPCPSAARSCDAGHSNYIHSFS